MSFGCTPDFTRRSVGYVGFSDRWQDLMEFQDGARIVFTFLWLRYRRWKSQKDRNVEAPL